MIEWLFGAIVQVAFEWILIATGQLTLRVVSFGWWEGSDEAFLWRREGDRIRLGCFITMLASVVTWIVIGLTIAAILARHA